MPTAVKCHPVPSFTAQQRLSSSLELLRKFSCLHGMVSTKKCNLLWPPATCIIVTVQREWQRGEQGTMVLALCWLWALSPTAGPVWGMLNQKHSLNLCCWSPCTPRPSATQYFKRCGAPVQNNHTCQNKAEVPLLRHYLLDFMSNWLLSKSWKVLNVFIYHENRINTLEISYCLKHEPVFFPGRPTAGTGLQC